MKLYKISTTEYISLDHITKIQILSFTDKSQVVIVFDRPENYKVSDFSSSITAATFARCIQRAIERQR